ncbi:MAG: DUF4340 domain-containing protein [Saprospiraceae bacterium]|nr:DUF4340 domain-containing protein [Saprospiraceae bacterium]
MKNKHLLFIFLLVLLLGLVARYAPWFKSDRIHRALIQTNAREVTGILVQSPGNQELKLQQTEYGWLAIQDEYTLQTSDSIVQWMLQPFVNLQALRIVNTQEPDTFGFDLKVSLEHKHGAQEVFSLGKEVMEAGAVATFIRLEKHGGIYLATGHLRPRFYLNISHFKSRRVINNPPETWNRVRFIRPGKDTSFFVCQDSTNRWLRMDSLSIAVIDTMPGKWPEAIESLNQLTFASVTEASFFDDDPDFILDIFSKHQDDPQRISFFGLTQPKFDGGPPKWRIRNKFCLVHASENAFSYFKCTDVRVLDLLWEQ